MMRGREKVSLSVRREGRKTFERVYAQEVGGGLIYHLESSFSFRWEGICDWLLPKTVGGEASLLWLGNLLFGVEAAGLTEP